MKAEELRIGNYYNHNCEIRRVSPNTIMEVWESERIWCKPIPLTEEWLLKFGFKYNEAEIEYFIIHYYTLNDIEIKIEQWKTDMKFDESHSLYKDYGYITSINYVHQLQNLYFALTSEELTVKP